MPINIVKKENNDNVFIYDSDSGAFKNAYGGGAENIVFNPSEVRINLDGGYVIFKRSEINSTQVEPNAAVPFSGSSEALADLLATSFFYEVGGGSGPVTVTLENTIALQGYAPKYQYYLSASPANGVINLGSNEILFNPGFPIQIYKTQSVQSTVVHTTLLSAGNLLIGLYKYDYPNEKFTLAAEWLGPISDGFPKYTLSSPVDLTPGTYFTGYTVSSGGARGTYSTSSYLNVVHVDPYSNYENTGGFRNKMRYALPSSPITTMPGEILQSDMDFSSTGTPILPPTIIFE